MADKTEKTLKKERKLRKSKQGAFIELLRNNGGHVSDAAKAIGVVRSTVYLWRDKNEGFAATWDDAVEEGTDRLEQEAFRRAHDGTVEPVYYQGKLVKEHELDETGAPTGRTVNAGVRKYSDTLMIFLLKARRPEKYRERSNVELTGKDGAPLNQYSAATTEELAALAKAITNRDSGTDDGTGTPAES